MPKDLELEPSTLTLISLVHLPDQVLDDLAAKIGATDDVPHVVIHNWPDNQEPCSRPEMYRIFQAIKPLPHDDVDETFLMFIDGDRSPDGYHVIFATEVLVRSPHISFRPHSIVLSRLHDMQDSPRYWHAIWNPFEVGRRGTRVNNARANCTIFDSDLRTKKSEFEVISDPDHLSLSFGVLTVFIFILSPMTESELRRVRWQHFYLHDDPLQFIDVSQLIHTPDIEGLVSYFESEDFAELGETPPSHFLAIDDGTLGPARGEDESLDDSASEETDLSDDVIVVSSNPLSVWVKDDEGRIYAQYSLGYGYARLEARKALDLCSNLEVGNMDFIEVCQPEYVYWGSFQPWIEENEDAVEEGQFSLKGAY